MNPTHCTLAALALTLCGANAEAAAFSTAEIEIITRFYETSEPNGPRGQRLPRGIAKNLARGKVMPPGIAKQHLPVALTARLPPPPVGYERLIVAGKILLIEAATHVVHDVLDDVLFR